MSRKKYRLYDGKQPKPFLSRKHLAEKIIGVVILGFIVTIISVVLAFEVVFNWTWHIPHQTYMQGNDTPTLPVDEITVTNK